MRPIRVGTRGSTLAVAQTRQVIAALREHHPQHEFQLVPIQTSGDRLTHASWQKGGQKGLYVKELEEALLDGDIELAVHSAKDLPTSLPEGLSIGAWLQRSDARDVLVLAGRHRQPERGAAIVASGMIERLAPAVTALSTSSTRRRSFLLHRHPGLTVRPIRGNVDTRIRKLDDGEADGLILAAAGLLRLGLGERIDAAFDPKQFVPAPGQGALAVEMRADRRDVAQLLAPAADPLTAAAVTAERAVAEAVGADCRLPLGAYAWSDGSGLDLVAAIGGLDGKEKLTARDRDAVKLARQLGQRVARDLIRQGGDRLLARVREEEGSR